MIDVEDALASLPREAEGFVVPVETVRARAHRRVVRRRAWRTAVAAVLVVAGIGTAVAMTRSHPKSAVTVQPSGLIGRADAIAALRSGPGTIAAGATVEAKLVTFDDYAYTNNNGDPLDAPAHFLPSAMPAVTNTLIWLVYVHGPNTIALGHGPPAAWALGFIDAKAGVIGYRFSEASDTWPHWALLPDRSEPGDRDAFCAVARRTVGDNRDVPSLTPQQALERRSVQISQLLAVAPPDPRDALTTLRTYLEAAFEHKRPAVSSRAEDAALAAFDRSARDACGGDLGHGSILGSN